MEDELLEWKRKNSKPAGYVHFDKKIGLNSAWEYITNPDNIKKHSFYPLISYDKVFYKVSRKNGELKTKKKSRAICYSSHMDRWIYKYYGYLLNEKYNKYVDVEGMSNSVIAYRTNLHKNNIHFAKEAFDFIKKGDCNIIIGDFKSFFDNLDHKYLKRMLRKVLVTETLTMDWYAIYKNITKYSTWDLIQILKINNLIKVEDLDKKIKAEMEAEQGRTRGIRYLNRYFDKKIRELNGFISEDPKKGAIKLALSKEDYKLYKKEYLKVNRHTYGIPQGSAISAVLSNVYMIEFDKKIYDYVKKHKGLYLRYSDDFIIILPKKSIVAISEVQKYLNEVVSDTDNLVLESEKTQMYSYEDKCIYNISEFNNKKLSYINYLGFTFDGKDITIKDKTISKYYYRMYRKLNHIVKVKGITKKGNRISYRQLYMRFTQKGRSGEYKRTKISNKTTMRNLMKQYNRGNFFTYVYKADKIFNSESFGKSRIKDPNEKKEPIMRSTKRHMLKIRRIRDKIE